MELWNTCTRDIISCTANFSTHDIVYYNYVEDEVFHFI
jgi:hypothetical protein